MREEGFQAAFAVADEQLTPEAGAEPIDQFIDRVIEAAGKREDFDAALLAILSHHILKEDPADEAVAFAAAQIEALAETRALAAEEGFSDGEHNA